MKDKKLLILGAYESEIEIVEAAKKLGVYTIVTDNHANWELAPAKYIADEGWDISWSNIEELSTKCIEENINGCIAGFSEKRVMYAQILCKRLGLPFYTDDAKLDVIFDKLLFKEACHSSGIPTPKSYSLSDVIDYPIIVKPADNGGSRGITICHDAGVLSEAINKASLNSVSKRVVIEQYITGDEVMIYYTIHNGNCTLSAMCDRLMHRFSENITQLPVGYYFPSKYLKHFQSTYDMKFKNLIKTLNIKNGLIAFQSFVKDGDYIPFDPTYRLDGTVAFHITQKINSTNVLNMLIAYSLSGSMGKDENIMRKERPNFPYPAFEIPILLGPGTISCIIGIEAIQSMDNVIHLRRNRRLGEILTEKADFSQIFCRILIWAESKNEIPEILGKIFAVLRIEDQKGKDMIINRFSAEIMER